MVVHVQERELPPGLLHDDENSVHEVKDLFRNGRGQKQMRMHGSEKVTKLCGGKDQEACTVSETVHDRNEASRLSVTHSHCCVLCRLISAI